MARSAERLTSSPTVNSTTIGNMTLRTRAPKMTSMVNLTYSLASFIGFVNTVKHPCPRYY